MESVDYLIVVASKVTPLTAFNVELKTANADSLQL